MTEMYIRGDDRDLTREFENVNFTYTTPSLSLRQENLTIIASFLNTCKLTIKIKHREINNLIIFFITQGDFVQNININLSIESVQFHLKKSAN